MKKLKLIHGAGEIKRISPQIKDALNIIDGHDLTSFNQNFDEVRNITNLGFSVDRSSGIAFIGKRQVIKVGLLTRIPPRLKYRVPTLFYNYEKLPLMNKYWDWVHVVMIQPRANVDDVFDHRDAMDRISESLTGDDYHSGNFGIHRRKLKLIDW